MQKAAIRIARTVNGPLLLLSVSCRMKPIPERWVQGKQTTPHFKLKEREDKPSSEWIRVEGAHEAIIQKHDFDLVQRLRRIDTRPPRSQTKYICSPAF